MKSPLSLFSLLPTTVLALSVSAQAAVTPNSEVIPAEKHLPPAWENALFDKGKPESVSSREALMHIGMPVGGLFCGTLYLGGDGKLWLWDIFNDNREGVIPKVVHWQDRMRVRSRDGAAYVYPENTQPSLFHRGFPLTRMNKGDKNPLDYTGQDHLQQGFILKTGNDVRTLDAAGWESVRFTGTYPIGTIEYSDKGSPVSVTLEAFSPFIPLNTKDSSLPVTVMSYTVTNHSSSTVEGSIGGWLENAVCCNSGYNNPSGGSRINKADTASIFMTANGEKAVISSSRENIVFEDFEKDTYDGWTIEGTAFSNAPLESSRIPPYMGDIGMQGGKAAVSHNVREGGSVADGDNHTGSLLSPEFTISRNYINFMIAGGNKKAETGLRLLIDGKVIQSATGHNSNKLRNDHFDVSTLQGKKARLLIEDKATGGWGNTIVDHIVFSDVPDRTNRPLEEQPDYGSLCLSLADPGTGNNTRALSSLPRDFEKKSFFQYKQGEKETREGFGNAPPLSALVRDFTIPAGKSVTVTFLVSWYFPNIYLNTKGDSGRPGENGEKGARHYAADFKNAGEVSAYTAKHLPRLTKETRLWRDTWYDSTLPCWFLDRTFANTSTLATTTSHRFTDGRFYAWEGIGSCPGTCTHVWQYAQAPARLFPDIERHTREHVDLGIGFTPKTGRIGMRAEHHMGPALDGQCGRIMGIWREHTMSPGNDFLKRLWPNAKKAVQYILDHDSDKDGIMDGAQENTLDAAWYGQIAWISIESLGALKAGEEMALAMGDEEFAKTCRDRRLAGQKNIEQKLFNGKWFYQIPDPKKKNTFGTYNASFIDQLFGQSMAYQCGLGDIITPELQKTALRSIWTHNFATDFTKYLEKIRPLGRPYYTPGEGGTLMCTNALDEEKPYGGASWTHGYLNECMTGFEHQYASHLMQAGMIRESLAVTYAIHDRYRAEKRNPYNEIECSDHYSRAMASYGTYLSACGYQYNGPKGELTFEPRITPDHFQAAFTTAEGWGTYTQAKEKDKSSAILTIKYGRLSLNKLVLPSFLGQQEKISATLDGNPVEATVEKGTITFKSPLLIQPNQTLIISL